MSVEVGVCGGFGGDPLGDRMGMEIGREIQAFMRILARD